MPGGGDPRRKDGDDSGECGHPRLDSVLQEGEEDEAKTTAASAGTEAELIVGDAKGGGGGGHGGTVGTG